MSVFSALQRAELPAFSGMTSFTPAAGMDQMSQALHRASIVSLGVEACKRKIRALGELGQGWDGFGSPPATTSSIANASVRLDNIYQQIVEAQLSWNSPHLTVSERGEVVFEWWRDSKRLSVYFEDSEAVYLKVWGANIYRDMEDGVLVPEGFLALWTWLNS